MISIITATYNSEKTISKTLNSLLNQTYTDWELLICDGSSTDNTLNIINAQCDHRIKIVSTTDSGIFDAYNKGLEHITGEIFGTLNSDDHLSDETTLNFIYNQFKRNKKIDLIYGNVTYLDRDNPEKISRKWRNNFSKINDFKLGFMPAHPTVYIRNKKIFTDIKYKPSYSYVGDFEYLIRIFKSSRVNAKYINKYF